MKKSIFALGFFTLSVFTLVLVEAFPAQAQGDASITFYRGTVTEVNPASWTLAIKTDEGAVYTFHVARSADLQLVAVGDRIQAEAIPTWGVVLFLQKTPPVRQAGAASSG